MFVGLDWSMTPSMGPCQFSGAGNMALRRRSAATLVLLAAAADAFVMLPRAAPGAMPRPCLSVPPARRSPSVGDRPGRARPGTERRLRARAAEAPSMAAVLDDHIEIDPSFPGLRQVHSSPDIFLVDGLLSGAECDEIVEAARGRGLELSPVAYAGWTEDAGIFARLLPVGALPTVNSMLNAGEPAYKVALVGLAIWAGLAAVYWGGAYVWSQKRTADLQKLRTSTSTILDGKPPAQQALVSRTERLIQSSWKNFECPTVIRYESGQVRLRACRRWAPMYTRACVRVCVRVRACACVRVRARVCICAYMSVHTCTSILIHTFDKNARRWPHTLTPTVAPRWKMLIEAGRPS